MREIKVIGLILPLALGIKVTLFPWTPDRLAASKQKAQASDSSERTFVNTLACEASLRDKKIEWVGVGRKK